MRVALVGFGSLWTVRPGKDPHSPHRFTRDAAYFNTTGVLWKGRVRTCAVVYGVVRVNGACGLYLHGPSRLLNRVVECAGPAVVEGANRLLVHGAALIGAAPDRYLVALASARHGAIDRTTTWRAGDTDVLSFSERAGAQECLLLCAPYAWVRTAAGLHILKPEPGSRSATLRRIDGEDTDGLRQGDDPRHARP